MEKSQGIAKQCVLYQPGFQWLLGAENIQQLYKAKVLRMSNKKAYNVRLYFDDRKYKLTAFSVNRRQKMKNAVDAINAYIQKGIGSHFVIPKTSTLMSQVVFWFFIVFSIYFLSLTQNRRLVLDKNEQVMSLSHISLLNKVKVIKTIALPDVEKFELDSSYGQKGKVYSIIALLKNGSIINVESVSTNFYHSREKIIKKLNDFLIK